MQALKWKTKIGLEIHAQIVTATKLFSPSRHISWPQGGESRANSAISLFDIGFPGTLPRLNKMAVTQAVRTAKILNCEINKVSMFERKHYFYQDLPLGYQITQQMKPIALNGRLDFDVQKDGKFLYKSSVGITRIQLEQDSGKSIHDRHPNHSLVDLNRAGVGLLEIVFAPDLQTSDEAVSAIKSVQRLLRHINICDGNMQDGSMRCDVNISVAEFDSEGKESGRVGDRVEIKNLNSMQRVTDAVEYEIQRHIQLLESGQQVPRETRKFDIETGTTNRLRSKETAVDYRIFPDPDLPLLTLTEEEIQEMTSAEVMPELPDETASRIATKYDLTDEQANRLMNTSGIRFYEETVVTLSQKVVLSPQIHQAVYHWIFGDLMMHLNELGQSLEESIVTPKQMSDLILMILPHDETQFLPSASAGEEEEHVAISGPQAKTLLRTLFHPTYQGASPGAIVTENRWKLVTDPKKIRELVQESVRNPKNSKQLKKYFSGNQQGMVKFFFGDVMKLGKGQVDPKRIEKIVVEVLAEAQEGQQDDPIAGAKN
jgi:aspartyl-tRNA(Asn)/glutamyl-tRNA(Gln) amidotransferase subunit B